MTHACWLMKTRLCWCYLMFEWVVMRTDKKHFEKSCKEQYLCSFPLCSSHTVFKQWRFIQQPSLKTVIEWGSQVMMSNGTVSLKPCRTNLTFITQLLFLAKSCKPGRPIFYLLPLPPTPTPAFSPASRVERISLTSMCWTVYFIFLKCPETEHSSVNKYKATCMRALPSSEGKQMCSNECPSSASFCTFSVFEMLIFKWGTQGNMLKNKSALQCFSYWNCYGRSDGHVIW